MNQLVHAESSQLALWDDSKKLEEVRKLFAPGLTELEFQFFVGIGKAAQLNPFLRELWAVKYDKSQPAQVFIGRDGYRKAAQAHIEYDYHQCDAVYENDKFEVIQGEPRHAYTLTNRGKLVGAYCIAKRHKSSRPMYVFVDIGEYSTGKSVWRDKPATMIKKVAESQCLRACFQDLLGGTYGEEEISDDNKKIDNAPANSETLMNKLKSAKGHTVEAEKVIIDSGELCTQEQVEEMEALLAVKDFEDKRYQDAMAHYNASEYYNLTKDQAEHFISVLNKCADKQ